MQNREALSVYCICVTMHINIMHWINKKEAMCSLCPGDFSRVEFVRRFSVGGM